MPRNTKWRKFHTDKIQVHHVQADKTVTKSTNRDTTWKINSQMGGTKDSEGE
jgi:hypothetical protein